MYVNHVSLLLSISCRVCVCYVCVNVSVNLGLHITDTASGSRKLGVFTTHAGTCDDRQTENGIPFSSYDATP